MLGFVLVESGPSAGLVVLLLTLLPLLRYGTVRYGCGCEVVM